jgi:hypothetical protein
VQGDTGDDEGDPEQILPGRDLAEEQEADDGGGGGQDGQFMAANTAPSASRTHRGRALNGAASRRGVRQIATTTAALAMRNQATPSPLTWANSSTAKDGPRSVEDRAEHEERGRRQCADPSIDSRLASGSLADRRSYLAR